ncbi:MAG: hypothetical protein ACI89L_001559 [Phycisphaerales bacterium]|jgi:hypothetical protein
MLPLRSASPALILIPLAVTTLPGCIAWDIKHGIEDANANLQTINDSFAMVEATNERLDRIDANLKATEERIATLQVTLESVEASLVSLRKTINNIDSTIPFLKFSGDDEDEKDALETGIAGEGGMAGEGEPQTTPPTTTPTTTPETTPETVPTTPIEPQPDQSDTPPAGR